MQTHSTRLAYALSVAALVLGAGCSGSSSTKHVDAYLASEHCSQSLSPTACAAESDCHWVATGNAPTNTSPGGPCLNRAGSQDAPDCVLAPGVCASNDPCLALDKHACAGDSSCAWSQTTSLCPVGASCNDGGYCHASGGSGGSCACLSPIACPANAPCPTVECDCSGGGGQADGGSSSGGGSCTCACPACAPGEDCAPCDCDCNGGSPGCQDMGGTCACACPLEADGTTSSSCDCNCGTGPVSGTDPCNQFTDAQSCEHNGQYTCGVAPGPGGAFLCVTLTPSNPCSAHTDAASCNADTANGCGYVADPCPPDATACGGECVQVPSSACGTLSDYNTCVATTGCGWALPGDCQQGSTCPEGCVSTGSSNPPPPVCNCPACPAGVSCNCACTTPPVTPPACPPPPVPTPPGAPTPVACPQLNCPDLQCASGTASDANGCPTCTCL